MKRFVIQTRTSNNSGRAAVAFLASWNGHGEERSPSGAARILRYMVAPPYHTIPEQTNRHKFTFYLRTNEFSFARTYFTLCLHLTLVINCRAVIFLFLFLFLFVCLFVIVVENRFGKNDCMKNCHVFLKSRLH